MIINRPCISTLFIRSVTSPYTYKKELISLCQIIYAKEDLKTAKGRKMGSMKWLTRQINDPYVKRANRESYRCRSAYKLIEIDEKYKIFQPGQNVVDCGAAPGSWTQVALQKTIENKPEQSRKIIGVDLQHITPIPGAILLCHSDFTSSSVQKEILQHLDNQRADLVLSDMAPNASGVKTLDHEQSMRLVLSALEFSFVALKDNGTFLCKIFQGAHDKQLNNMMNELFQQVKVIKPKASREESAEVFLLAMGFRKPS